MSYSREYEKVGWENGESGGTPLNKTNMKHMDDAIYDHDGKITDILNGDTSVGDAENLGGHPAEDFLTEADISGKFDKSDITTSWNMSDLSDTKVPSEKLTKNSINEAYDKGSEGVTKANEAKALANEKVTIIQPTATSQTFTSRTVENDGSARITKLKGNSIIDADSDSIINFTATSIKSYDSDGNLLAELPLDLSNFGGSMKSAGSVYDEKTDTRDVVRVGSRAYQSGDESDSTLTTDGTTTNYPLATPIEYNTVNFLDYPISEGGTEEIVSESDTSALVGDIAYGLSGERHEARLNLDENAIVKLRNLIASLEARIATLEGN